MPKITKLGLFPYIRFNVLMVGATGSGKTTFTRNLLSTYASEVDYGGFPAKNDDFTIDSKWRMDSDTCQVHFTIYDAPEFGDVDNTKR
jgi:septin family protein